MKIKHFLLACSIGLFTLAACHKEEKTTAEKVQGKWQLAKITDNEHSDDKDVRDTTVGTAADYLDFRADGKLYTYLYGDYDTSNYVIQSDLKIRIGGASADIQTLTDKTFRFYSKQPNANGPSAYYEVTFNLKK
jgi:hypothetical protein